MRFWLTSRIDALPDRTPVWLVDLIGTLTDALVRLICPLLRHVPERDQCMRPEHDFCLWCHKPMPGQWRRP